MTAVDVQRLLEPISGDQPAGPDLDGTPDFQALVIAATGRPETEINGRKTPGQEPDWAEVRDLAEGLLTRTKDLQIAVLLTEALIRTDGLPGLRSGLALLHGLLETLWESVWPELDLEDREGAALFRLNRLKNLGDHGRVVRPVREIKLPGTRMLGSFSPGEHAELRRAVEAGEDGAAEKLAGCEASLMEADLDQLREVADAARESLQLLRSIEALVDEKADVSMDLGLAALADAIGEVDSVTREFLMRRGENAEPANTTVNSTDAEQTGNGPVAAAAQQRTNGAVTGRISSRADVIKALDQACRYFEEFEPSSPVPLLLKRAKRLIAKDFITILRDMAPRGIEEAENIAGTGDEAE